MTWVKNSPMVLLQSGLQDARWRRFERGTFVQACVSSTLFYLELLGNNSIGKETNFTVNCKSSCSQEVKSFALKTRLEKIKTTRGDCQLWVRSRNHSSPACPLRHTDATSFTGPGPKHVAGLLCGIRPPVGACTTQRAGSAHSSH